LTREHAIDSQPNLGLNLRNFVLLLLWHYLPSLVFELFHITLDIFPYPRFVFQERYQNARHIIGFHKLMDNSHRQIGNMVTDEPYYTEANHPTVEFNFFYVVLKILDWSVIQLLFWVMLCLL
jgi:hypothetical protein